MHGRAIGIGVDRNGSNAHLLAAGNQTYGNLAAIGN
jgi:hypothetical protein